MLAKERLSQADRCKKNLMIFQSWQLEWFDTRIIRNRHLKNSQANFCKAFKVFIRKPAARMSPKRAEDTVLGRPQENEDRRSACRKHTVKAADQAA
jgi:hypothetical protein